MKRVEIVLAMLLCLCLLLPGCGDKSAKDPELSYSELVGEPLDKDIATLLSAERVSAIMGTSMSMEGVYEDGTQMVFKSANGKYQVIFNMKNMSRTVYDGMVTDALDAKPITGLGEAAYALMDGEEILAYSRGYGIDIWVSVTDTMVVQPRAEQLVRAVLEGLA